MSAPLELSRGQNAAWRHAAAVVEVVGASAGDCDVSALLLDERHRAASSDDLVFYHQPTAPGVTLEPGPPARVRIDLAAVPARVQAVLLVVSVDPHLPTFGALPPLTAVLRDGAAAEQARFVLDELTSERAVVAVEVYRRGPGWKVRAVGQGYDGGLAQAVTEHGIEVDDPSPQPTPSPSPSSGPVPPPGTSDGERLMRTSSAILEDAARSTAALRSSVEYAGTRRDRALADLVADPRLRGGPAHQQAAAAAEREHADLVGRARERHDADLQQLAAELAEHESRLPAPMAPWTSGSWRGWRPPAAHAPGVRVGDLHVEEAPWLRLPLLLSLPLARPLWVDAATGTGDVTALKVRAIVSRMLAAYPAGGLEVVVVDLVGGLAPALASIAQPGSRVMRTPVATSVAAAADVLDALVRRVDLVQMARSAGAMDALDGDGAHRLLVLHDFPTALDDAAVGRLRYLVDEGPSAGVQVLVTGEHSTVLDGSPLVTTVFRESLRLPLAADDHLVDAWTHTQWRYTPDLGPDDAAVLDHVLRTAAGTGHG